jgi:hypothetical protein
MNKFTLNHTKIANYNIPTINYTFIGSQYILTSHIDIPNTLPAKIKNKTKTQAATYGSPQNGVIVKYKLPFMPQMVTNDAKVINIRKDTSPIRRGFSYNYYKDQFISSLTIDRLEFCQEQKISTVFSTNSYNHWFSTFINPQISFKKTVFSKIIPQRAGPFKNCNYPDSEFDGSYIVDITTSVNDNQLVFSSNRDASKAIINFDKESNYIIVKIYSKKIKAYVDIKMRPPVRYRPAYNDWVFDESLIIDNIISNTEYVQIINYNDSFRNNQAMQ